MQLFRKTILLIAILTMAGCATCDPNRLRNNGIVIGVVAGGLGGVVIGGAGLMLIEGAAGGYVGSRLDKKRAAEGPCIEKKEEEIKVVEEEEINLDDLSVDELTASLLDDLDDDLDSELPLEDESVTEGETALADEVVVQLLDLSRTYQADVLTTENDLTDDAKELLNSVLETLKRNQKTRVFLTSTVTALEAMSSYLSSKGLAKSRVVLRPRGASSVADVEIKLVE